MAGQTRMTVPEAAGWAGVAVAVAAVSSAAGVVGVPSPTVIAALLVGMAAAWRAPQLPAVGARTAGGAQAVIGVVLGLSVSSSTVTELAAVWLPVLGVLVATIVLSLAIGALLHRASTLDPATAVLASVPGGAIGLIAMARELGADDRLVAFGQYLRVLMILTLTPLVGAAYFVGGHPHNDAAAAAHPSTGTGAVLVAVVLAGSGWAAGRRLGMPASSLLGPLLLTATMRLLAPDVAVEVPAALREIAFALVGLDVGLRFTGDAIARVRRALGGLVLSITALLVGCAALGGLLSATTDVPLFDAYLATTPGGLTVVAATAYGAGADTPLIVAVQTVRLIVMLAVAPAGVRVVVRRLPTSPARPPAAELS